MTDEQYHSHTERSVQVIIHFARLSLEIGTKCTTLGLSDLLREDSMSTSFNKITNGLVMDLLIFVLKPTGYHGGWVGRHVFARCYSDNPNLQ